MTDTPFNKFAENLSLIPQRNIKDTKEEIKTNEITGDHIQSVDITVFYKLLSHQDGFNKFIGKMTNKKSDKKQTLRVGRVSCQGLTLGDCRTTKAHVEVT